MKEIFDFVLKFILGGGLLSAVTYFVKRHYDRLSDIQSTRHQIFQQNKLEALHGFYKQFTVYETTLRSLDIPSVVVGGLPVEVINEKINQSYSDLRSSFTLLSLYLNDTEMAPFNKIHDEVYQFYLDLTKHMIQEPKGFDISGDGGKALITERGLMFSRCSPILTSCGPIFRKIFHSAD